MYRISVSLGPPNHRATVAECADLVDDVSPIETTIGLEVYVVNLSTNHAVPVPELGAVDTPRGAVARVRMGPAGGDCFREGLFGFRHVQIPAGGSLRVVGEILAVTSRLKDTMWEMPYVMGRRDNPMIVISVPLVATIARV